MKKGTLNIIKKDKSCKYCLKNFETISGASFANHVRWCEKNPVKQDTKKFIVKEKIDLRYGQIKEYKVNCFKCNKIFIINEREKNYPSKERYYCSIKCSNTRIHSLDTRIKISKKAKISSNKLWENEEYIKKMFSNNRRFTSKAEIEVRSYFINNFNTDEWTYGGNLTYKNVKGIVRDLYSPKLKICIEYDGVWHFEDIKGQLKSKQEKDKALELWCNDNDFRLIRIDEDIYNKDSKYWINELVNLVYNTKFKLIKIGCRY